MQQFEQTYREIREDEQGGRWVVVYLLAILLLTLLVAGTAVADPADPGAALAAVEAELAEAETELVRARGFVRGAETQVLKAEQQVAELRAAVEALHAALDEGPPVVDDPPTDPGSGGDPPATGEVRVVRVVAGDDIAAAIAQLRDGHADQLLFRRGDTFRGGLGAWAKSGASAEAPMIVGAFGPPEDGPPRFMTDGAGLVSLGAAEVEHVVFRDLHAVANRRDPSSPDFAGGRTWEFGVRWLGRSRGVRFERLKLELFAFGLNISSAEDGSAGITQADLVVEGCMVLGSYAHHADGHAQGMGIGRARNVLVRGCVFDHNGWHPTLPGAGRTGFNQNVYLYQIEGLVVEGNVFSRGSNLGLKLRSDAAGAMRDVRVEGNLFIANFVGMAVGGDDIDGDHDALTHVGLVVRGNVFTAIGGSVNPDGRDPQGIGISIKQVDEALVEGNLFAHKPDGNNWYAVEVAGGGEPVRAITLRDNTLYRWPATEPLVNGRARERVTLAGNAVNLPASTYTDPDRGRDAVGLVAAVLGGELAPSDAAAWVLEGFQ